MKLPKTFINEKENALSDEFIARGYVILPVENKELLDVMRDKIISLVVKLLNIPTHITSEDVLNNVDKYLEKNQLNQLRLKVIEDLNQCEWFRPAYYTLAKGALEYLVGNELAMQKRINLSIQLPNDDSSLLALHADTWSGDSAFEVVVWLPLVDCFDTKSMYITSPEGTKRLHDNFSKYNGLSSEDLYQQIRDDAEFIDIKYGYILIFNQCLPHGNRVNEENETRWTMNCRFKSVFTPYKNKKLGEFFEPITLKTASMIGMEYRLPCLDD